MLQDKEHIEKSFGRVIKELRRERKMSQAKLAELADFNRTFISDLERGIYQPTLYSILKLAKALEIKPHELMKRFEDLEKKK